MRSTRNIFGLGTARSRRRGFTLMEVALAITIIGIGILSMVKLVAACTQENSLAKQMTVGMLLADHVQEAMAGLPFNDPFLVNTYFGPEPGETLASFNDIDDFDGSTFNPPIDSLRQKMPQFSQYSQVISVWPVLPIQLNGNTNPAAPVIAKSTYTGAVRVVVIITYRRIPTDVPFEVYRTSWIRMDR
jgi:prepilin-type N-terminal cleavage/methylation domain-containing protein